MVGKKIEFEFDKKKTDFFKKNIGNITEIFLILMILVTGFFSYNLGVTSGMHEMCGDYDLMYNYKEDYFYCDNYTEYLSKKEEKYYTDVELFLNYS